MGQPIIKDKRYVGVPIPRGESLKTVKKRVVACFDERIAPILTAQQTVLIVAHGNSLRALIMHLEDLSAEEIINRNIPTGVPITIWTKTYTPLANANYSAIEI